MFLLQAAASGRLVADDGRVNPDDMGAQTETGYCRVNQTLEIWTVVNSGGKYLYKLTRKRLIDALAAAQKEHKHQLVSDMNGYQLYALFTQDANLHELQLHDANHGYDYVFILCAWPQS